MKTAILAALGFLGIAIPAPAAEPFAFAQDERIVFLGSTLVEREQKYGHWEAAITAAFPEKNLRFRNFGWSGDTVWGESRAGFDTPKEGFKKLVELTLEWKPTTLVLAYGANESFDGEKGLPKFEEGYAKLLDALAPAKAKVILLSPFVLPLSKETPQRQEQIKLFKSSIESLAAKRKLPFGDLQAWMGQHAGEKKGLEMDAKALSDDGMQLNSRGYRETAPFWKSFLSSDKASSLSDAAPSPALTEAIVAKNRLVFYRWRPQNETYLFGFRKHEQGKNGKEVFAFDPLIEAAEKRIAELKAR